ncbi:transporter [Natronorubrum sp. JWXQ-INN-674]|uniref:Transporter n=1 Tax=Natronorubrum halalkaliphilum TaxID=2691917 RepID=A0A6B0VHQ6_9EURY|nr:transporter [Natronorubrum halalkaliphilum]MXV61070.1 transporter [Natronorubrum halalkaliphilum]
MVRISTIVIVIGIVLLPVPIPPFATIAGILLILTGLALRVLTDL